MGIFNTLDRHFQTNRAPCPDSPDHLSKIPSKPRDSYDEFESSRPTSGALTSFRPAPSDLVRLKTPLGQLLSGTPTKTMPKLKVLVQQSKPSKVTTVGDVVSRETLTAGIQVHLRIVDQMTLRKRISPVEIKAERTYRVTNPAGVITSEAWDTIKEALKEREAVIFVDGEED